MKKLTLATLTGIVFGGVSGAALAGVNQYFIERGQSDWAEIEKWMFVASIGGAILGAAAGGVIGLVFGALRHRISNDTLR